MGPHRPRAPEYTPTGGSLRPGSSRPGSLRPIGPGPSALAHRPRPMEPMGPHMGMYFWILYFRRKVDPLGESIRRLPGPLGGSDRTFVQQRLPPELPRVARAKISFFIKFEYFIIYYNMVDLWSIYGRSRVDPGMIPGCSGMTQAYSRPVLACFWPLLGLLVLF